MGKGKVIAIGFVALLVALGGFSYYQSTLPGSYDDFAKCLTESDVTFYGAWWCPHCAEQKNLFGKSVKFLPYVECSTSSRSQNELCTDAGIESYPTWEFADGSRQSA